MSQIVMFSEDYGNIPSALYLATRNFQTRPVTLIIPANHDLYQFFQVINEKVFNNAIRLIYLEPYRARRVTAAGIKKVFWLVPDVIGERRYLKEIYNKYLAQLEGCEAFFFSRGFGGHTFYLLRKISKKNRLVYMPYTPSSCTMSEYSPANVVDLAHLIILKLIYGRDMTMGKYPQVSPYVKGFPYMSQKFMEKRVAKVITAEERGELMKGLDMSQFKILGPVNYSVIYLDDGLVGSNYTGGTLDRSTFGRELAEIFRILTRYFPAREIARKYHPGYHNDKSIVNVGAVLPDFIPAEFLYNNNVKMYLSICSFSLANVETGLAVSIADLISFPSDNLRNQLKENLMRASRSRVLFPKSLDEFEGIVRSINKTHETCRVSEQ